MLYKLKHFEPLEIVPAGYESKLYLIMDRRVLYTLDEIRDYFGAPVYCNRPDKGLDERGFRIPSSSDIAAKKVSQHCRGCAADIDVTGHTAEAVRREIINNKNHRAFQFINRLEAGVSWIHFDCAEVDSRIVMFNP